MIANPPSAPRPAADARVDPRVVFWSAVVVVFGALAFPIWYGQMPPLTDFASHVQLIHGYVGASDPASVWHHLVDQAPWWQPNGVWVHLSSLLYPLVEPLTALRFWFTATLFLGVVGHVRLLETFGRSRWLVFIAMPLLMWNGMAALGFVNFVPALAIVPWVMVAARRAAGPQCGRGDIAALIVLPILAVWFHGLGGLLVIGCASFVIVASAPFKRLGLLFTVAPAVLYWSAWFFTTGRGQGGEQTRDGFVKWLTTIRIESLGFFEGLEDDIVFFALLGLLLIAFVGGLLRPRVEGSARRDDEPRGVRAWLHDYTLVLLALVLLAAYRVLPRYSGDVALAERVIPVFIAIVWALPRPSTTKVGAWLVRGAVGASIAVCLVFAFLLAKTTVRFDTEELAAAIPLIDQIPSNTRAQCVNVRFVQPHFYRRPLDHGCNGVLASRRNVFAGGGFADTPHNAIRFKPEVAEHRIFDEVWQHTDELALVDWLLVRGPHVPPRTERAAFVAAVEGAQGRIWTLYRSLIATAPEVAYEAAAGGDGGQSFSRQCPVGFEVGGIGVAVNDTKDAVEFVGVQCLRQVDSAAPVQTTASELVFRDEGWPRLVTEMACLAGQRPVGLGVYADAFIHAVRLSCEDAPSGRLELRPRELRFRRAKAPEPVAPTWFGAMVGQFHDLRCPTGTVLTGVRGRRGAIIDQLVIRCSPAGATAEAPH